MRRPLRQLNLFSILVLLPGTALSQHVSTAFLPPPAKSAHPLPTPGAYVLPLAQVPIWRLAPLSSAERASKARFGAKQLGMRRDLGKMPFESPLATKLSDGRTAVRVVIRSPGAVALRVHIVDAVIGGGELWFYAPSPTPETSGAVGTRPSIAGPYSKSPSGSRDFWSGLVESDTVVVEFDHPAGTLSEALPFRIDAVSHHWADVFPQSGDFHADSGSTTGPASCELDITCYPSYANYGTGVPLYTFVADTGGSYACSGAMVNTASQTFEPYMLTANHCIGSETEAQSLEAFFGYQTQTCNGTAFIEAASIGNQPLS